MFLLIFIYSFIYILKGYRSISINTSILRPLKLRHIRVPVPPLYCKADSVGPRITMTRPYNIVRISQFNICNDMTNTLPHYVVSTSYLISDRRISMYNNVCPENSTVNT